ncbi:TIM21 [Aspergillus sp. HF37]|nr:TIM21 [Aspergillus sp. HF37]
MIRYLRPSSRLWASNAAPVAVRSACFRPSDLGRSYATHSDLGRGPSTSTRSSRKNITVLSDDGRLQWGDLSGREKVSRATQQSVNFMVVLAGAVLTGGVFTLLYLEVFSPNSSTWQFEKAVERIKDDSQCTDLLGDRRQIKAYGQSTWSRWARNRPIATSVQKDQLGRDHLRMNFNVEGPLNRGVVQLHMVKPLDKNEWQYLLLSLDVHGHRRINIEKASDSAATGKKPVKLFGIQWR